MANLEYGPVREDELDAYAALLNRCFGQSGELEQSRKWLDSQRREDLRTLRAGERPIAALSLIDMGQFFGGRSVRSAGVAGVGIEPDRRGQGCAKELMTHFLSECRAAGYPLSTLFASTYPLYRSVGYERAGGRWVCRVAPGDVGLRASEPNLRPASADDEPRLEAVWGEWARVHSGNLDRAPYNWQRVRKHREKSTHAVLVEGEDGIEGYLRWLQVESKGERGAYDLVATDVAALTPAAGRRILAFFASHGSLAGRAVWASGPGDPLFALLPERYFDLDLREEWMVRVVDVAAALEGRGYPVGQAAELHLEVEDDLFPENGGRYVLEVAEGRGAVRPGGEGRLACSIRGLAPLYTGYRSARQLAQAGWISGDDASLAAAEGVFAGPSPWMADTF